MENLHIVLKELQSSLQHLLKKYSALKAENEQLKNVNIEINRMLQQKDNEINTSEEKLATTNISSLYNTEEKELLQKKIGTYLKDIEKCLALLNN